MNVYTKLVRVKFHNGIFLSCFLILICFPQVVPAQSPWDTGSFFPPWSNIAPVNNIVISDNTDLETAVNNLQPGDRLLLNPGTYTLTQRFSINVQGTAVAPIWVVAADPNNKPIIVQQAGQNTIDVVSAQYLVFQNLEITGGSGSLVRLENVSNFWIDQCFLHDGLDSGIQAIGNNTSFLYITRNEIENPGTTGGSDGINIGSNDGSFITSDSIIALNHIHQIGLQGGSQGEGIDINPGSYNNWIVSNLVHDTNLSSINTGGAGGNGINLIERNTLYNSNDVSLRVGGEAIVRNNLMMDGSSGAGAFFSQSSLSGDPPTNLSVIHNTLVSQGTGAKLREWNNGDSMVFANNVVYSRDSSSIDFLDSTGVVVTGNVVLGQVQGVSSGFIVGNGLEDFVDITWDATSRNGSPSQTSAFRGTGDPVHSVDEDINGIQRVGPLDSGAFSFIPFPQCNDGIDNDGDSLIDLDDPGCEDINDNDEFNAPPLPQCSDTIDNDGDGLIDFPNDPGCIDANDDDEFNAPPPNGLCNSSVATVEDLQAEVDSLSTSGNTIQLLTKILASVQKAVEKDRNKKARNKIGNLISKTLQRSHMPSNKPNAIPVDQANSLICGAANLIQGLDLP